MEGSTVLGTDQRPMPHGRLELYATGLVDGAHTLTASQTDVPATPVRQR